jgi:hypothetical protein
MHERISTTGGRLTVATSDPSSHLNVIIEGDGKFDYKTATLTPMQARALRDVLNKAYPPVAPEAPKPVSRPWGAAVAPVSRAAGNHIVALFEDGKYKPNAAPYVHTNLAAATHEAERLAKLHGKDFVVFKPVVAAKAEVIRTVNVKIVNAV